MSVATARIAFMSVATARIAFICTLVAVTASCSSSSSKSNRPAPARAPQPATQPAIQTQPGAKTQPAVVAATAPVEDRRALGVPPGHIPAPGSCRLWFPGQPPGKQPRPGDCRNIEREAPAGSWVLYRPQNDAKVVHAHVIDPKRAGVVVAVRVYEVNKGTYLREEKPAARQQGQEDKSAPARGGRRGQH